uniref:Arginine-containing cyclodipeptide synthase pthA n=1 Tax=Penicillium thymicola TaxID=293382 RepID=PTHA_PENTH|nr:PthA [Penicillium thymicola]
MSTLYLLANLRNRPDGRHSIDFGSLSARESDPVKMPHEITGLFSSDYCSSTSTTLEAEESEAYSKALSRNKRAAGILEHFLNGEQAAAHPSVCLQDRARLRLCEEAILVGAPRGTATRAREGIASYDKMEFLFPGSRQRKSIQMLHVSCPSLQPGATLLDSHSGSVHDSITILSGMCLFTRKILNSTTTNGRLDGQKLRHMPPTLYEMECIARLSAIIADVTTLTQSNFGEDNHPAVNIVLDLPSWHYYQFIEDCIKSDTCSLEEAIDWTEAIKLRRQQLASVLKKAVWHELGQRQVAHKSTLKAIQISPESTVVDELIKETLQRGHQPRLDDILHALSGTPHSLWPQFYSLLRDRDKPHSIRDLGFLFYVFQVVRPALLKAIPCQEAPSSKAPACEQPNLHRGQRQCLPQRPLIISLDDRAERKIYSQAHSLLLRLSRSSNQLVNPTLVQLYMPRRVYIDGNKDGQRLYWHDPSPVLPLLEGTKEQQRRDARNHDHHRRELQQTDILTELYGRDCSANIQGWFKEAGLC